MKIETLVQLYIEKTVGIETQIEFWNKYCKETANNDLQILSTDKIEEFAKPRSFVSMLNMFGSVFGISRGLNKPVAPYMVKSEPNHYVPVQKEEVPQHIDFSKMSAYYTDHKDKFAEVQIDTVTPSSDNAYDSGHEYYGGNIVTPSDVHDEFMTLKAYQDYEPLKRHECEIISDNASQSLEDDDSYINTVYEHIDRAIDDYVNKHPGSLLRKTTRGL